MYCEKHYIRSWYILSNRNGAASILVVLQKDPYVPVRHPTDRLEFNVDRAVHSAFHRKHRSRRRVTALDCRPNPTSADHGYDVIVVHVIIELLHLPNAYGAL